LFVSHDRAFVAALATRLLEVTERGFQDFPGTYQEYLEHCGDDHLDADAVVLRAKAARASGGAGAGDATPSWEEKKRRNNRQKQLPQRRDQVLQAIELLEARKATILAHWCEPGFYEKTSKEQVFALETEERELGPRIDALLAEWEAIEAELSTLPG
jgi:ATPase subunit of ABC transporter with duplicated ATPase domains